MLTAPAFRIPDGGVLLQGATGRIGRKHMAHMRAYGTHIVGGISPTAEDREVDGVPIFGACAEAVTQTGARSSVVMVPPLQVLDAIRDAVAAGIELVVTVTEGMPISDAVRALALTREAGVSWVGASTPGIAVPGRLKLGFLPDVALRPGRIGFASKSGTLSYEIGYRLAQNGLGQSVWVGVGGDPVKGTRFADLLPFFNARADTDAIAIVGEIGGSEEEELADAIRRQPGGKQVYAIVAGQSAREGIAMGHAGALVDGNVGTIASKKRALEGAGVKVFTDISAMIGVMVKDMASDHRLEGRDVFAFD